MIMESLSVFIIKLLSPHTQYIWQILSLANRMILVLYYNLVLAYIKFGDEVDHQIAKLRSPSNVPCIRYFIF